MKTLFLRSAALIAALLAAPLALQALGEFQGQIDMQVSVPKKTTEPMIFHYTLKEHKVRFEMPQQAGSRDSKSVMAMVINYDTRLMYTLIDTTGSNGEEHKMAIKYNLPDPQASNANGSAAPEEMHPPTPTGKTETILGYKASEYTMTTKRGEEVDLWLAKGLGSFMSPSLGGGRRPSAPVSAEWEQFARDSGFFPMRTVTHDKSGKETMRMEVVKINKAPVSDQVFSIEGYQEMEMPSFSGKSLMNGLLGR